MNTNAIVIFDGSCPLCSREIAHYRKRRGAERIDWIDASREHACVEQLGMSVEQVMAVFHARDTAGVWHTGAAGFLYLWSQLPAYRWLASSLRFLRLQRPMEAAYRGWLRWRNRNNCDAQTCAKPPGRSS